MLKANEIRLGNKLFYNTEEGLEVTTIDSVDIKLAEQYNLLFNANHSPIPITKDMLLKYGGEINRKLPGIKVDRFRLIWKESYNYWYVIDNKSQTYLTKIEFVHELQNFVFIMNGTELEIKL
jgi:hypothetical protein